MALSRHMSTSKIAGSGFVHEALLYADEREFLAGTLSFIRGALARAEPILVAVAAAKIQLLSARLGREAESVSWIDMAGIGQNPARIIPLWRRFVADHGGRNRLWGIGEPVWAGRSSAELVEAERHEALLNVAFAEGPALSILCPYDTGALEPAVIHEAHCNHPVIRRGAGDAPSAEYRGVEAGRGPFDQPLHEPPGEVHALAMDGSSPANVRKLVGQEAAEAGLHSAQADDLTLAVIAAGSTLANGGGAGTLTVWRAAQALTCEIRYPGRLEDPLAGREWPPSEAGRNRGLWVANQLCDLVQLRSFRTETVARLHMVA
jgi:hypothetical protein